MLKSRVTTISEGFAYILDCQLATVCDMAAKRSRPKFEFARQRSIAQTMIDWALAFNVDVSTTRGAEVMRYGSVDEWCKRFFPEAADALK